MTYGEGPEEHACVEGNKNKIMHACLSSGDFSVMASDNPMAAPVAGDNVHLSVHCETMPQIQKLFRILGEGGDVKMPLADTFWGAHFGMLIDRFGIHWMLNCPLKT